MAGNGFAQIKSSTIIKYVFCRSEDEDNKLTAISSEKPFSKPIENSASSKSCLNCPAYILYYFEVKVNFEKNAVMEIGLEKDYKSVASLFQKSEFYFCYLQKDIKKIILPSFSLKNGVVLGCGFVYPPPSKMNTKLPYIFFTTNGKQIGKAVLFKENYEYLKAYVLFKCFVEANFGDKPFLYNISKHYVAEEFYKDEEFSF